MTSLEDIQKEIDEARQRAAQSRANMQKVVTPQPQPQTVTLTTDQLNQMIQKAVQGAVQQTVAATMAYNGQVPNLNQMQPRTEEEWELVKLAKEIRMRGAVDGSGPDYVEYIGAIAKRMDSNLSNLGMGRPFTPGRRIGEGGAPAGEAATVGIPTADQQGPIEATQERVRDK